MPRTWMKNIVRFVMICVLLSLWRAMIPRYTPNAPANNLSPQHPILSQAFLQSISSFERPLHHSRIAHWDHHIPRDRQSADQRFNPFTSSTTDLSQTRTWHTRTPATAYRTPVHPSYPLTPHSPIIIHSDAEFASQGWPGNGTQENPYTITNLNITVTSGVYCILIENTRVHFVIANCWMEGEIAWWWDNGNGIFLANVTNGLITNTTCFNLAFGIELRSSGSIELFNNTCFNSHLGIVVFNSSSTKIISNTCEDIDVFGCEIYPVNNNIIANNSLVNCGFFFGVWEQWEIPPAFTGVGSLSYVEPQITGNLVNYRPLIFWQWRDGGTVPLEAGQIILLNCIRVTVQDQHLNKASIGIFLHFTNHTWIDNNICTDHSVTGIRVQNSVDVTVKNNFCANNSHSGISLDQSHHTTLINNTCNQQCWWEREEDGIGINLLESHNNQLLNNTCDHNCYGIILETSHNNQLLNNTCTNNWYEYEDWFIFKGGGGIFIFGESNMISWNLCNDNWVGIRSEGQQNSVMENTYANNGYGIILQSSTSIISKNLGINNGVGFLLQNYTSNTIIGNSLIGCSFKFEMPNRDLEWRDVEISGNTVNGRPLVFWQARVNDRVPPGAGQIILFNCRRIIVEGQNLTNCSNGLHIANTNQSLFTNNILSDITEDGILVTNSYYNHFTGNILSNCLYGLDLYETNHSLFTNNILLNCLRGFNMYRTAHSLFMNNILSNIADCGIRIDWCYYNHFSENILTNCSNGFSARYTDHCLFTYNILSDNTQAGIQIIWQSSYNHILGNLFANNSCSITFQSDPQNNTVEWNTFLGNQNPNAFDDGPNYSLPEANIFDRNFWSDYTGVDANLDGYGDTAYNITGAASNRDLHPIMSPVNLLAIRSTQRLLLVLDRVATLILVIIVVVLILVKFRRHPPNSPEEGGISQNSLRR